MIFGLGCAIADRAVVPAKPPDLPYLTDPGHPAPLDPTAKRARSTSTRAIRMTELRTTLGRASIRLDTRGSEPVLRTSACSTASTVEPGGCARCVLTTGADFDGVDPAVIEAITIAFARYPTSLLIRTGIEHVTLCEHIVFDDKEHARAAGMADLEAHRLLINLHSFLERSYDPLDSFTMEDIVHHELFHLLDWELAPDGFVDDPEWGAVNPTGFRYGPNKATDPVLPGFVNSYAATNAVEDRATVFQYLMARPSELCTMARSDRILAEKTQLVWRRIERSTGIEFLRERATCVTWINDTVGKPGLLRWSPGKVRWGGSSQQESWVKRPVLE